MDSSPSRPFGILIVEDEPIILRLLSGYLRSLGATPFEAAGATEAERVLRDHETEIGGAILDLNMPGCDGFETRRRLHAVKPEMRFCLMSGAVPNAGGLPEGFCHSLDKPFGLAQLRACLEVMRPNAPVEGPAG